MKRILVIENELIILNFLSDQLKRFGYSVARTQSGDEALEKLNGEEYDGIFLDIHLKDMSGKDLYQKVKQRRPNQAKRIMFVTGDLRNPKTAAFVEETGCLSLEKPFTVGELKELLNRFFEEKTNPENQWGPPLMRPSQPEKK